MHVDTLLFRADVSLRAALQQEVVLRAEYLGLLRQSAAKIPLVAARASTVAPSLPSMPGEADVLERSARSLEFMLVIAAYNEVVVECGIKTFADFKMQTDRLLGLVRHSTGLDPMSVIRASRPLFSAEVLERVPNDNDRAPPDMQGVLREGNATLAACPIEELEEVSRRLSLEQVGHRCRHAYDALTALLRRNDPSCDRARKVIGLAYSEARLSLAEAAAAMQLSLPDAIVFLEEHGYARPLKSIELAEEFRTARYEAMRRDRFARAGAVPHDAPSLVVRNVIANQRIEGVDARRWVRRDDP